MGLDMYLYRFPRYKWYGPKEIVAFDVYMDWKNSESGQKHTLEQWSGVKEEDLPNKEDWDYLEGLRGERFAAWDDEHDCPNVRTYDNVAYWRKANAVHKWFVNRVQDGEDDCEFHREATKNVLEDLREVCRKILESTVLVRGKVKNGYRLIDGKKVYFYVDGELVVNSEVCEKYLPATDGYFFGSTEYDQYYIDDVKYTYEVIGKILEETDFEKEMIYYRSSW